MSLIDRLIAVVSPQRALVRRRAQVALGALMNYDAAVTGRRSGSWVPVGTDADAAAWGRRAKLAFVSRDMVRNTPLAARIQAVVANNVVGDGIIPKVITKSAAAKAALMEAMDLHLNTTDIDADGRNTLSGLQRLAMVTVVESGEVLIRRRWRLRTDGFALPFQLQILEPDYLDTTRDSIRDNGNIVREGIEYDLIGRRVAYWLYKQHPGTMFRTLTANLASARVPAEEVIHVYRQDRPGQRRGVSWFANIAMAVQDLADHQDAQLLRQKIAACFAAFRIPADDEQPGEDPAELSTSIMPGRIQNLAPGEDIRFAEPPGVQGYDEFKRSVLRDISSGVGLTYEAVSGDLSNVNFSSGRMGRMEMDRNVSSWQWHMLIPQMMDPVGKWVLEAWDLMNMTTQRRAVRIGWVAPHRMLVDPEGEIKMMRDKVRAGLTSRSETIRTLGEDPEQVAAEIEADNQVADDKKFVFDSDPRRVSLSGVAQGAGPQTQNTGAQNGGQ